MKSYGRFVFNLFKKEFEEMGHELDQETDSYVKISGNENFLLEEETYHLQQQFPVVHLCVIKSVNETTRTFILFLSSKEDTERWNIFQYHFSEKTVEHVDVCVNNLTELCSCYDELYHAFLQMIEEMNENRLFVVTQHVKG